MNRAWIPVKITKRAIEAEGIVSVEMIAADGGHLPPFSAGAHVDVELPNGLVRQYSLCSDSSQQDVYKIAVLLEPESRGGSRSVHEDLHEGLTIRISEPKNHFPLEHAERYVLFAGGIGVTPILSMAMRLASGSHPFVMHYCTRSASRMAFQQDIQASLLAEHVHFHFDDGDDAQKLDIKAVIGTPDAGTHLYVCGPKGFMDFVINTAKEFGWAESNIHFEYFSGATTSDEAGESFDVKISSTGQVIHVNEEKSVTQALMENGIELPVSCEQGVCGTCVTRVLEGVPDHRDLYFTDAEKADGDQFTPCCSRAKTPLLVLDL